MKKMSLFSALFLLFAVIYAGCKYNGAPGDMSPGKTIPPNSGSVYVYNNTPIDTNGHLVPSSSYTTIDSVAATGITYNGKTNVTKFSIRNLKTGLITSSYINFESNGDISEYVGASILSFVGISYPDWVTYPMQTHTSSGIKVVDTTIQYPVTGFGTVPLHIIVTDSITYINWSIFSFNNTSLPVFNMKHHTNFNGTAVILTLFNSDALTSISFAPSIGYYADKTTQPFRVPLGLAPPSQGSEKTLVSYNLK